MRLRAWDVEDGHLRVRFNKWLAEQALKGDVVWKLELRNEYTEKLHKIPPMKIAKMSCGVEPNGDCYIEIDWVPIPKALIAHYRKRA